MVRQTNLIYSYEWEYRISYLSHWALSIELRSSKNKYTLVTKFLSVYKILKMILYMNMSIVPKCSVLTCPALDNTKESISNSICSIIHQQ